MDFVLAMLAIVSCSLFLTTRCRVHSSAAPFFSVITITLFLCLAGMTGFVYWAVWLVYAGALLLPVYVFAVRKTKLKEALKALLTPGMVFFLLTSAALCLILYDRNPYFLIWDEFSFWGSAAKSVFLNRQIYTIARGSMQNYSYPPALPLFSWFIQFFGSEFAEWKVYLAYDVLLMSVMSLLFARVRWRNVIAWLVLTAFGALSLYQFWHSFEGTYLYMTSYSDLELGALFGGVLLSWFALEEHPRARFVLAMIGVTALPMVKDVGFALGLVASGIFLVDSLIARFRGRKQEASESGTREFSVKDAPAPKTHREKKPSRAAAFLPLLFFAGVIASYAVWAIHFQSTTELSRLMDPYEYSALDMLRGLDPDFNTFLSLMLEAMKTRQLVMFGPLPDMMAVFTAVPIAVGILTWRKRQFLRMTVCSLLMLGGFLAYYLFMTYVYTAVFSREAYGYSLVSYARYMSSYTAGWMLAVCGICLFAVGAPKWKRGSLIPGVAVALVCVLSVFYFAPPGLNPDQYLLTSPKLAYNDDAYLGIRQTFWNVRENFSQDDFTASDRFYFVCQDSDGGEWYYFNYDFMPSYTVKTYKGGNLVPPDKPEAEMGMYDVRATPQDWIAYLREEQVGYVYVYKVNEYFSTEFRALFTDSLAGYFDRSTFIYMVADGGGDDFRLVPVSGTAQLAAAKQQYGT